MAYITLSDGLKRYYEEHGPKDGRAVLLFHGWCASCRLYSEQMPVLAAAGYRAIAFDALGHGRSDKEGHTVGTERLGNDLKEMGGQLGFWDEPFAVIGHSAGGGAAQMMYLRQPEKVAALVLLNTGYRMRDTLPRWLFWSFAPLYVRALFSEPVKKVVTPLVKEFTAAVAGATGKDKDTARLWVEDVFSTSPTAAAAEISEIMKHDTEKELPNIKIPVCIIGGTLDALAPARQSKRMHELIPDSELHLIPGEHTMKIWHSREVNDIIMNFLARVYPAKRRE